MDDAGGLSILCKQANVLFAVETPRDSRHCICIKLASRFPCRFDAAFTKLLWPLAGALLFVWSQFRLSFQRIFHFSYIERKAGAWLRATRSDEDYTVVTRYCLLIAANVVYTAAKNAFKAFDKKSEDRIKVGDIEATMRKLGHNIKSGWLEKIESMIDTEGLASLTFQ